MTHGGQSTAATEDIHFEFFHTYYLFSAPITHETDAFRANLGNKNVNRKGFPKDTSQAVEIRDGIAQKSPVLAEFSAVLAENSASTADFCPCACFTLRNNSRKFFPISA
jgi:hypothetical protein